MRFPQFETLADDEPALDFSPLTTAVGKILDYGRSFGAIELTKAGNFKRKFVEWSVQAMDWPGYRSAELKSVSKVLNEADVDPLVEIHDLMVQMKLARHIKAEFRLTNGGEKIAGDRGRIFGLIAPFYLYRFDRTPHTRWPAHSTLTDWDVYLNVLNLEADQGASCADLADSLLGTEMGHSGLKERLSDFRELVLRPLCWLGLIAEVGGHKGLCDQHYAKTPLWRAALRLDTDSYVDRPVKH